MQADKYRIERGWNIYPDPVCMACGNATVIGRVEEVEIGGGEREQWTYCKRCRTETFHEAEAVSIRVRAMPADNLHNDRGYKIRAAANDILIACDARLTDAQDHAQRLANHTGEAMRIEFVTDEGKIVPVWTVYPEPLSHE